MSPTIVVNGRTIGAGHPPWVVAELSGNHNGSLERARAIVSAAATAGADAVKLQTYTADTLTIDHDGPEFQIAGGLWGGRTLHDLYEEAHTPWEWHEELFAFGRDLGITIFSAPFDTTAIDLLETCGCPLYKVASPEIVDLELIAAVAATGKPVILSTGMATLAEIDAAVQAARNAGASELAVLHCVSGYPTPPREIRLGTISHLAQTFGVVGGLSDHTMGIGVPVAATALGASIIEKHLTLRRAEGGVDSAFSLEPDELRALVDAVSAAHDALGEPSYEPTESEVGSRVFRRSLYVVREVAAGEALTRESVRSIRPGLGLEPAFLPLVLTASASRTLRRGEALDWSMLSFGSAS
jgi:pseudaminic acid synthase